MSTQAIRSRENPNLELIAFHGHFATRHSHNVITLTSHG